MDTLKYSDLFVDNEIDINLELEVLKVYGKLNLLMFYSGIGLIILGIIMVIFFIVFIKRKWKFGIL